MKTFVLWVWLLFGGVLMAQQNPIVRNPYTTNLNPPTVASTNLVSTNAILNYITNIFLVSSNSYITNLTVQNITNVTEYSSNIFVTNITVQQKLFLEQMRSNTVAGTDANTNLISLTLGPGLTLDGTTHVLDAVLSNTTSFVQNFYASNGFFTNLTILNSFTIISTNDLTELTNLLVQGWFTVYGTQTNFNELTVNSNVTINGVLIINSPYDTTTNINLWLSGWLTTLGNTTNYGDTYFLGNVYGLTNNFIFNSLTATNVTIDNLIATNVTIYGDLIILSTNSTTELTNLHVLGWTLLEGPVTNNNTLIVNSNVTINGVLEINSPYDTSTNIYQWSAALTVTNGLTNFTLTANTVLKADANKAEASIANGTGFLHDDGAGTFAWIVDGETLTNLLLSAIISPTNGVSSATAVDFSVPEATTNTSGNVAFTSLSNFNPTNYNQCIRHIIPSGADRTVTVGTGWKTDNGTTTYTATNGVVLDLLFEMQPNVFTNVSSKWHW